MTQLVEILNLYNFSDIESQNLLAAMELVGCPIDADNHNPLESLNEALQSCFLRPQGSERQELNDKFQDEELRTKLLPLLSPFINSINTGNDTPTKMLLGAAEKGTKERFEVLVDLENNGHHADVVYLLGGKRELWIDYEPIAAKLVVERVAETKNISKIDAEEEVKQAINEFFSSKNNISAKRNAIVNHFTNQGITWPTEADMMEKIALNYKELSNTKFILVNAPMKLNNKGQLTRPDTLDTFNQLWLDHGENISLHAKDQPNNKFPMAIVTTQPYGTYQHQQAVSAFHNKPVNILVVASGITDFTKLNIATVFDSFARTIYAGKSIVMGKIKAIETLQEL